MAPKSRPASPARRLYVWIGLALLVGWLLVQNTVLLLVMSSRLEWSKMATHTTTVWRAVEVVMQTVGPQLIGGALLAIGIVSAAALVVARVGQREARHA
jgi:hypothetical protein